MTNYVPYSQHTAIGSLLGLSIISIEGMESGSEEIKFECSDGQKFVMFHSQDCCESVYLEDVEGDFKDLLDSPLLIAEECTDKDIPDPGANVESYTWTFYRLATEKGYVVLRWFGMSNGCYSESVDFARIY